MASSILNSDDGVVSGTAGLKTSGGDDGILEIQTNGVTSTTIDASGNVGIGTTPSAWTNDFKGLQVKNASLMSFSNVSATFSQNAYFDGTNWKYISTDEATQYDQVNDTHSWRSAASGTAGNNITWVERARITSGGYLKASNTGSYFGSTSAYHELITSQSDQNSTFIVNSSASPYTLYLRFSGASPNNGTNYFLACDDNVPTRRASILSNGGLANYSANNANLSDRREKTNFAPAKNYLETICAITVQTFNYIDQNLEEDDGITLGVVAQDVQEVAPELVMESNWGTEEEPKMRLSIYQTDLQYALMKSIQELKAELDTVKAELETLKGN